MNEAEDSSPYLPTPQQVFTSLSGSNNQDYSCTHLPKIEHASTVKKDRDRKETKVNLRQKPY